MAELANCPRCNAVFVKGIRTICQSCYKEEEEAFQTVYHFLRERKNREATLMMIVEATNVEEELIMKFVKEKRLRPTEFPNLAYPCERCGTDIISGKLCVSCTAQLKKDLTAFEETEKRREEMTSMDTSTNTYYAIDKHKK
ncbi:TIGR03826 family flagellar region protein [Oceanobacillus massiliensis]|uniref:TIGR03826 family flagellar region protein n=1 Tax=Oceanobacillus massiliensis TaxID=1465765 RepID=UPI0030180B16